MPSTNKLAQRISDLKARILRNRNQTSTMSSGVFWRRLGYERRTESRIASVEVELKLHGIKVSLPEGLEFGREPASTRVTFSLDDSRDTDKPVDASWFTRMMSRTLDSEREVEVRFSLALLVQLGFDDDHIAIGKPVTIHRGGRSTKVIADLVVYAEESRKRALLLVENKRPGTRLTHEQFGQAASYARWLPAPVYIVTNSDTTCVFINHGALISDTELLRFERNELSDRWNEISAWLNPSRLMRFRETLEKGFTRRY